MPIPAPILGLSDRLRDGAVGDMAFVLEDFKQYVASLRRWPEIFLSGQKDFPFETSSLNVRSS